MSGAAMQGGLFTHNNTETPVNTGRVLPLFSLKGRTAIVTGGANGIGLQISHALAEAGANIAIMDLNREKAAEEAVKIEKEFGVKAGAYQVDISVWEQVNEVVTNIVKDFNGRLDVFIANAGIPWTQGPALEGSIEHYQKVIKIDLDGTYYCARAAGAHWRRQKAEGTTIDGKPLTDFKAGSFVATGSMSGHIVNIPQMQSAYNFAKAGVIHLCKSLAVEWVAFARVNSVSPGYIATELTTFIPEPTKNIWRSKIPMGREGAPFELKGAYLYLASDAASYTTGTDISVDGGYILP